MNSQYEFMQNSLKNRQNFNITKEDNILSENHRYEKVEQQVDQINEYKSEEEKKEENIPPNENLDEEKENLPKKEEEDENYGSQEFTKNP